MKKVWKCDYCLHTNILLDEMKIHEKECSFNPIFKNCWSCKYQKYPDCEIEVECHWKFEEDGNCKMWKTDDEKLIRKLKLDQLNKLNKK
jgi:hypothetical protein